jgi:hypothetical protein
VALSVLLLLMACSGSSSSSPSNTGTGTVNLMVSDASTEDWAVIGVKVQSIALIPKGRTSANAVTVFTANPAPVINLVQLDQLAEILGNVAVPAGTYTGAVLTVSASPSDVILIPSNNPEAGFAGAAGVRIPTAQIQVQSKGSATVNVPVNFVSPLVVTADQSSALNLEFDLSHPAFIVDHTPAGGTTLWSVNFDHVLRHHPLRAVTELVLRHMYGSFTSVSSDNISITITKVYPTEPVVTPETSVSTAQTLQILADSTSGTFFYDLDAKTSAVIKSFSTVAPGLTNRFVRVAARYQSDGTLVATRVWAGAAFNTVWINPEGHVLHVTGNSITVESETPGSPVTMTVNGSTQFFFGGTQIGTGTGFLANLARGFKVNIGADLTTPTLADFVDIQIAKYDGAIQLGATTTSFTYKRVFNNATDGYTQPLGYISNSTPNGLDGSGAAVSGFEWWYFAHPTGTMDSLNNSPDNNPILDFVNAVGGTVNYGGALSTQRVAGASYVNWDTTTSAWLARWTVLSPTPAPLSKVTTAASPATNGATFGMTPIAVGSNPVTVDLSSQSQNATLVYQVDRTGGVITVTAQDITQQSVLNTVVGNLGNGTSVKVFGVPQLGIVQAYVLFYFTGTAPTQ